jgi:hypothetical protein
VQEEPADHGTNELIEVAYRFGAAVVDLATGEGAPSDRLVGTWEHLAGVGEALSGRWPDPRVPVELATQIRGLLDGLTAFGSVEQTVAGMDDATVGRTCQQVVTLAFALHATVGP